jgi:hypothetical protein
VKNGPLKHSFKPDIANFDDLRTENFNVYVDNGVCGVSKRMKMLKQTGFGMTFASRNVLPSFYHRPRLRKRALSRQVDWAA